MTTTDPPAASQPPVPEYKPSSEELAQLVLGMKDLANSVKALAEQQAADRKSAEDDVAVVADAARHEKRRRRVTTFIAAADVVLTIVAAFVVRTLIRQGDVQDCINAQNDARAKSSVAFFTDERDRLQGQVKGLADLTSGHSRRGFNEFVDATRQSLDFANARLRSLGVKFDKQGQPVFDKHGDPVIANPPPSCG